VRELKTVAKGLGIENVKYSPSTENRPTTTLLAFGKKIC
jgi:hypothetical protein